MSNKTIVYIAGREEPQIVGRSRGGIVIKGVFTNEQEAKDFLLGTPAWIEENKSASVGRKVIPISQFIIETWEIGGIKLSEDWYSFKPTTDKSGPSGEVMCKRVYDNPICCDRPWATGEERKPIGVLPKVKGTQGL